MSTITYLLQVSACTAIFYAFYYLLLRRLTFFTINRWYLMATLALSFIVPVITIPVGQQYLPVMRQTVYVESQELQRPAQIVNIVKPIERFSRTTPQITLQQPTLAKPVSIHWADIFRMIYVLASATLFIRLILTIAKFFWNIKGKERSKLGNVKVIKGDKSFNNGSFLNYIFLNDDALSVDEIRQIVEHEVLHVKLYHSIDRLLVKVAQAALWFNPFVYLYARSIEENHEFEVDREMGKSTDKSQYADLLLHLSITGSGGLYHSFSKMPLKRRINMLFTKPTNRMKKTIYLLVLPLVLISCLAFARFKVDKIAKAISSKIEQYNPLTAELATEMKSKIDEKEIVENENKGFHKIGTQGNQLASPENPIITDTGKMNNIDRKIESTYADAVLSYSTGRSYKDFFTRQPITQADGSKLDRGTFTMANGSASINLDPKEKVGVIINDVFYTEKEIKKYAEGKILMLGVNSRKPQVVKKNNVEFYVPFTFFSMKIRIVGDETDTAKIGNNIVLKKNKSGVITPKENKMIIDKAIADGGSFYERFTIHPNDNRRYDAVVLKLSNGRAVTATLKSYEKFGAIIDGKIHDEEMLKKLPAKTIASLSFDTLFNPQLLADYKVLYTFKTTQH